MLSRVADSLYWLGRYIERAENNARILDVNLQVTLDDETPGEEGDKWDWEPILATLEDQNSLQLALRRHECGHGVRVCDLRERKPQFHPVLRRRRARKCAHRARVYLERNVGAHQ